MKSIMPWGILVPFLMTIFSSCSTVPRTVTIDGSERTIMDKKIVGVTYDSKVVPNQKEKEEAKKEEKDNRLEERMNRPVEILNWVSLGLAVLCIAGSCLIQETSISGKLWKLAAVSGLIYMLSLGLLQFLGLLANPLIRYLIGGSLAVLGSLMVRMFWKKGFGCSNGNL